MIYFDKHSIHNCNAFNVLPLIKDDSCEVIITDPPYDFNEGQKQFLHQHFRRIATQWVIVFSPPENQWLPYAANQFLFWVKPISTKNTSRRYSRFVEMIFVFGEGGVWAPDRHWSQQTNVFTDLVDGETDHPYEKPTSLIKRLIKNHTMPGDRVFDPFCGSGTVPAVAKALGRIGVGVEVNPHSCTTAKERLG